MLAWKIFLHNKLLCLPPYVFAQPPMPPLLPPQTHAHIRVCFVLCWPPIQINILLDKFVNKRSHTKFATLIPCIISSHSNGTHRDREYSQNIEPLSSSSSLLLFLRSCLRFRSHHVVCLSTISIIILGPDAEENNYTHWTWNGCSQKRPQEAVWQLNPKQILFIWK